MISHKSIVELAPATMNLTEEYNLKETIRVFLRTKKFREINEGILRKPVSNLYLGWKRSIFDFLSLRNRCTDRAGKTFFKELSESFFKAYAAQSATEFWAPSLTVIQFAKSVGEGSRRYYEWLCHREGITPQETEVKPENSIFFFPLRMDYVPLDFGLSDLVHSRNKKADHLNTHFKPLFELLLNAAKKEFTDFDTQMRMVERGDTDVQSELCANRQIFITMLRQDMAYKAVRAHLPAHKQEIFDECIRLNEQFSIMNDLHGGFAMFNADLARRMVNRMLRRCNELGKNEVMAVGWCWRQIGVLYRLLEDGNLK